MASIRLRRGIKSAGEVLAGLGHILASNASSDPNAPGGANDPLQGAGAWWMGPRRWSIGTGSTPDWEDYANLLGICGEGIKSPNALYRTQPHLRTVVSYLASSYGQLKLHVFRRGPGGGRIRDNDNPVARCLIAPSPGQVSYDLFFSTAGDLLLHDEAYWLLSQLGDEWQWRRLPTTWVRKAKGEQAVGPDGVQRWVVSLPGAVDHEVPTAAPGTRGGIVRIPGYRPNAFGGASPAIDSLQDTLRTQMEEQRYRLQVMHNGGRVSAVLERPVDAPEWTDKQREAFREDWYSAFTGNGPRAGGTPILEDGMRLTKADFSSRESQFVEAMQLSLTVVAGAFHTNPALFGYSDQASFGNLRELKRMLYSETLGPGLARLEQHINAYVLPAMGIMAPRDPSWYAEFNLATKLDGSFEEQAAVLSGMVGRPVMTADEARARLNLPALGGDAGELVTPLNVLAGGQASPRDSGSQNQQPGAIERASGPTGETKGGELAGKVPTPSRG